MANTYTKAAFTLTVTIEEAAMLRAAEQAVDILDSNGDDADLALGYDSLGTRFHSLFPPKGASRFENFLALFDDWIFPYLDCRIDITEPDDAGNCRATFWGDQFGIEPVAGLIRIVCKSALPCGFAWISDCDRMRPGEFGGGCVLITEAGLTFHSTQNILDRAARSAAADPDTHGHEGRFGFVLASRDQDGHAVFWNNDDGFGALASATVFSEAEARAHDPVIASDEPEWLALPAPLAA